MNELRALFLRCGEVAIATIADDVVAEAWQRPSALPGMTVGSLAAHTLRALGTVARYVASDAPAAATPTVDAAGYVLAVLPDTERDNDVNTGVRARADEEAAAGHTEVVDAARTTLGTLIEQLAFAPDDRVVTVLDGVALLLDEYLVTRIVELVTHLADLDASVADLPGTPALPELAEALTVATLAEIARRRHGSGPMIELLARRERVGDPPPSAF